MYTDLSYTLPQQPRTTAYARQRVAMISAAYYPALGGIASQLAAVAPALQAMGFEVHVVTKQQANRPALEKIDDVTIHRLATPGQRALASLAFVIQALFCLRRLRPDVIHAHELFLPTTTALVAKMLTNSPILATAHAGGPFLGEVARLKKSLFSWGRLALLRNQVDTFVTISQLIANEMAAVNIPVKRRVVIPNGIDMTRFVALNSADKQALRARMGVVDQPIVVFTGRLASEKRVHHLLAIWPTVRAHYPNALLWLVGDGPEEASLRRAATPGVALIGAVDTVIPYLQAADLFVLPSVSEGFSLATLEALATGLAVIATPVGAIPDFITHGENGWIVPPDDVAALQTAVVTLLGDAALRHYLGGQARLRVVNEYSLPAVVAQLAATYAELASKNRAATWNEQEAYHEQS